MKICALVAIGAAITANIFRCALKTALPVLVGCFKRHTSIEKYVLSTEHPET